MKNIKLSTLLLAATLSFTSCNDYLTEVNPNSVTTDIFWKNLNDCNQGLSAVYNAFRNTNIYDLASDNNRSDLTYPGYGRPSTSNQYWLHTYTDASSSVNNKWAALYQGIFRTNQVISALNRIKSTISTDTDMETWVSQMAQARFFRGLFHFWLNQTYNNGDIIVYDFVPTTIDDFRQSLTKNEDVIEFYRSDLVYAYENLPESWEQKSDLGRVTLGAATAILGQSYLYEKDYETAKTYFKEIIESGKYELVDMSMNFTSKGEFNKESILEVAYTTKFNSEYDQWSPEALHNMNNMTISPVGGWRTIIPSAWLTMAYKEEQMDLKDAQNKKLDENGELLGYYPYSIRASYSLALVDDERLDYYQCGVANAPFNNKEYAYFRKNTNWDIVESEKKLNERSGVNYRIIRLADVYLMYAECLIQAGENNAGVNEALVYINRIRRRSAVQLLGMGDEPLAEYSKNAVTFNGITYDAKALMEHLMYIERPLELCIEGYSLRQIDLRRWGITKDRFIELSQKQFSIQDEKGPEGYFLAFDYIDKNGKPAKKWNARLKRYNPEIHTDKNLVVVDFREAAGNYNDVQHAYYPIPNSETMANGNLYK